MIANTRDFRGKDHVWIAYGTIHLGDSNTMLVLSTSPLDTIPYNPSVHLILGSPATLIAIAPSEVF